MPQAFDPIYLEDRYESGVYRKRPIVLVRGEGARVWDAEGREYVCLLYTSPSPRD